MSIVVMGAESPPEYLCGVTRVINYQRQLLKAYGWQTYLVTPFYPNQPQKDDEIRLKSITLPRTNGYRVALPPFTDPLTTRQLIHRLKEVRPDVVHLHGAHQVNGHLYKAAKAIGIPIVLQLHTDDNAYLDSRLPTWPNKVRAAVKGFQNQRCRKIAKSARTILCPSQFFWKRIQAEIGLEEPAIILPSAIPPITLLSAKEKESFGLNFRNQRLAVNQETFPLIVYVGRLTPEKNCAFALDVLKDIVDALEKEPIADINVPVLAFIGTGPTPYLKYLKEKALQLQVNSLIYFAGERPNEETLKILQCAKFCLLPSKTETQGLVGLETQLCQSLPIVLRQTALAEFVPSAELVLDEDAHQWAQTIIKLLTDPDDYHQKMQTNYQHALRFCDGQTYASTLVQIYTTVKHH